MIFGGSLCRPGGSGFLLLPRIFVCCFFVFCLLFSACFFPALEGDPHKHLGRGKYGLKEQYMNNIQLKTENWNHPTKAHGHFIKYQKPYNNGTLDDGPYILPLWARKLRSKADIWLYERQLPEVANMFPSCDPLGTGDCSVTKSRYVHFHYY